MKKKILLVGCGNIGSRHLQALVKAPYEIEVEVVDPSIDAQNIAKNRLEKTEYDKSLVDIKWSLTISNSQNNDLVILATPSKNRFNLIKTLVELGNKKFLIEKMVCQSENEYNLIIDLINSTNSKAWVNASRRYFDSYQKIKNQLDENDYIHLSVNGGNMGLGSNAIHFLDLFSWITHNPDIFLNGDFLDEKLLENKRGVEYKEFSGMIMGKSSNSKLSINFTQNKDLPLFVTFFGNKNSFLIDETNGQFFELDKNLKQEFKTEYQSSITTKIVCDIFETNSCLLPTLEESKIAHCELFRIFNEHIKKITHKEVEKCPIT